MKSNLKYSIFLVALLLLFGCSSDSTEQLEFGFLEGKVTIGPLCPVEMDPPSPDCLPTEETYKNWPIVVWNIDKTTKIAIINPKLNGNYSQELVKGSYIIDLDKPHLFGDNLPVTVVIEANKTKVLNIDIDTGIR